MKLIIRNSNGEITEQEITADMEFTPSAGEQYFFTGVENYTFNLTSDDRTLDVHFLDNDGERINVVLHNMAELIQQNDSTNSFSLESAFSVSTNIAGDQAIEDTLNNKELESGEIVEALKDILSMDGSTLAGGAIVDDFQGLIDALDATATGEVQNTAYNPLFENAQEQDVTPVEESNQVKPDNYGDNDNFIERAEGSYNQEINVSAASETTAEIIEQDLSADAVIVSMDIKDPVENTTQQIDLDAVREQGLIDNGDGTYSKPTYEETAKLYKTEEIEIGAAKSIRLDDAPDHGIVEVNIDGQWQEIVVGQDYDADIEVRFTPNDDALSSTRDVGIGTFGENVGEKNFSESVELSDWGDVADDGRSVTYTEGNLSVTTSVIQNGTEQELGVYNRAGSSVGAGIGDSDRAGLSRGEVMKVEFEGEDINQVEFQLDGLGSYFDESSKRATEVQITAYDKDGNEIDTQGGYRESGEYDDIYSFTTTIPVAYFELTTEGSQGNYVVQNMTLSRTVVDEVTFTAIADDGTETTLTSDINIEAGMGATNITELVPASDETITREFRVVDEEAMSEKGAILVDGTWVIEIGTELVETPMEDVVDSYEYPVDLSAELTDTDGSETLSDITVDNLPAGTTLTGDNVTNNGDGTFTVAIDENGEAHATIESDTALSNDQINEVTASVTSTESLTGDTSSVSITDDGELSLLGDMESIDLGNISEEVNGVHTINLESEPDHTLTVDAEDIVNANDDHEMVIVGHDGDVIDLEGEGWTKQEDHVSLDGEEGTFDHYSSVSSDGTSVDIYVNNDITVNTDDIF